MTDLRKAAEQALDVLDAICDDLCDGDSFGAEQIARHGGAAVRTQLRAALAAEQAPDAEALRRDAERYRWLRDVNNMRARELFRYYGDVDASQLDDAIDAAMKDRP